MSIARDIEAILASLHNSDLATITLGLARVEALLSLLGNPHLKLPPTIHIAGTNGKGSTLAYLRGVYEAAGLRVHAYTSPHLVRFNERIYIAGKDIDDAALLPILQEVQSACAEHPVTFFEATTAAAFLAFSRFPADVLLLEVGMGGRLDATNVVPAPIATIITPVAMDHMEFLGETITKIAFEKAGIIKQGVPCIVGPQKPEALAVIEQVAFKENAPLIRFGHEFSCEINSPQNSKYSDASSTIPYAPNLPGAHQIHNAATAVACIKSIPQRGISNEIITRGVANAKWPARLQRITHGALSETMPEGWQLWVDGGHNASAGEAIAAWAAAQHDMPLYVICGMVDDKDVQGFLAPIAPHITALFAVDIPAEPRSQKAEIIADVARACSIRADTAEGLKAALKAIFASSNKPARVLISGSLYLAGAVLKMNEINK